MRRKAGIITFALFLFLTGKPFCQQKKYYLSASGNDNNDGQTKTSAWRTIEKINGMDFKPGDSVFLEGGKAFAGTIQLTSADNGTAEQPVVFSSWGEGKAIINAGKGQGIFGINSSHIQIVGLIVKGAGVDETEGSGIHFFSNDSLNAPENIRITDCDVSGFRSAGIVFGCDERLSVKGYRGVRITHCNLTGNGNAGISSYGSQHGFQHRDFYIAYCKAFRNYGVRSQKQGHSGNGIVMAQINGLLIEHCEAYENGLHNQSIEGGPVGIWVWMCRNAVIQYCQSHHNYAGTTKDGGGFDIDGGASDCILQYNYSYNNEGAGYLLAEFGALFPFTNNIIRFNVSVNDGRKNGYGAITVWGASKEHSVTNSQVYNNTVYLDDKNIVNGTPAAVNFLGPNFSNVVIANNLFVIKGTVNFISSDTDVPAASALLLHNNYYSYSNTYRYQWGKNKFKTMSQWLDHASSQERWQGGRMALTIDPLLQNRKRIEAASKQSVGLLRNNDFLLQGNSSLHKNKFSLPAFFSLFSNTKDYCGHYLPTNSWVAPGACTD